MEETPNTPPPKPRPQGRSPLALLAIVLALAAAGGSGWVWWQAQMQRAVTAAHQAALTEEMKALENAQRDLQGQFDTLDATLGQALNGVTEAQQTLRATLESQGRQLATLQRTDRSDWVLAEADYLMKLANQRLLMARDTDAAHALLDTADTLLKDLDDSALFPVREQLARDIAAIHQAGNVDLEGIYLALGGLAQRAEQLALQPSSMVVEHAAPVTPIDATFGERLSAGFHAAWERLKDYIRIRRRDTPVQPLLAPDQESALRQSLRLSFELAQLALLAGKPTLYQASLDRAAQRIGDHFVEDDASAALIADINAIAQRQITLVLPDISGSRQALKRYRNARGDEVSP